MREGAWLRWLGLCAISTWLLLIGCPLPVSFSGLPCQTDTQCGGLFCVQGRCVASQPEAPSAPETLSEALTDHEPFVPPPRPEPSPPDEPSRPDTFPSEFRAPENAYAIKITKIEGSGTARPITVPKDKAIPADGIQASRRFQDHWLLEGEQLDKLTGIKLVAVNDPKIVFDQTMGLTLEGQSAMKATLRLPKTLIVGFFLIVGLVGTESFALGQVFILQGEGFDQKTRDYLQMLQKHLKIKQLPQPTVSVEAANLQVTNGGNKTDSKNGLGNVIIGYNEASSASSNRTGSHNLVIGKGHGFGSYGGIVCGENNVTTGAYASIVGGKDNRATATHTVVSGGILNRAIQPFASVSGGENNVAQARSASVSGGKDNQAMAPYSAVHGGQANKINAKASYASITGGSENTVGTTHATILGGFKNTVNTSPYATIVAGSGNTAQGRFSVILGGNGNIASGASSAVGGGIKNKAAGLGAFVVGGNSNTANGPYSCLVGGLTNSTNQTISNAVLLGGLSVSNTTSCRACGP